MRVFQVNGLILVQRMHLSVVWSFLTTHLALHNRVRFYMDTNKEYVVKEATMLPLQGHVTKTISLQCS